MSDFKAHSISTLGELYLDLRGLLLRGRRGGKGGGRRK